MFLDAQAEPSLAICLLVGLHKRSSKVRFGLPLEQVAALVFEAD